MRSNLQKYNPNPLVAPLAGLLLVAMALFLAPFLPSAIDLAFFTQAALNMLAGLSPYEVAGYYNPPWIAMLFIPLALLPVAIGRSVWLILSIFLLAYVVYRLEGKALSLALIVFSPPMLYALQFGNIEPLILLGLVLPRWLGILLLMGKPQIGLGICLYWLAVERKLTDFIPFGVAMALSFWAYGLWPLHQNPVQDGATWNISYWPFSLPLGAALLVYAIRRQRDNLALASGPAFAPYLGPTGFVPILLALSKYPLELGVVVLAYWALPLLSLLW